MLTFAIINIRASYHAVLFSRVNKIADKFYIYSYTVVYTYISIVRIYEWALMCQKRSNNSEVFKKSFEFLIKFYAKE